ncbi:MAG TPA: hypothetical protein VIO81_00125 [Methyloversatilis sp.]
MKKTLITLAAVVACASPLAFAGNKHGQGGPSPKSEHELTVGNEKAAESGSTADDKTVREPKEHKEHKDKKPHGKDHPKH